MDRMTQEPWVLVLAEESVREPLTAAVRTNGSEVLTAETPLEAIQLLERHSDYIGYAVLSPAVPNAVALGELLADEYPAIQRLVLL